MLKRLVVFCFLLSWSLGKTQCPSVYDYLGTLTVSPVYISCTGNPYALNFQSNASFGAYTINWGDATTNTTGATYAANSVITHTYAVGTNTRALTLTIPSLNCTLTGLVVMEKPVNASIQIPTLGITQACAPKTLTFSNSSTDVSASTTFTWDFGDGTLPVVYTSTNVGQNVTHPYNKGTVNCQTQVTLRAQNYCSFGNPTIANFNPIQIYDVDVAQITSDKTLRCWPDNLFTFTNSTSRNCLAQGNTFQRQEYWNLGNYWGYGHDSIIAWRPWPPSTPLAVAFPTLGTYNIQLKDSNLCGVTTTSATVLIVNAPTASVVAPAGNLCQNTPITFTNASGAGYSYRWNISPSPTYSNLGGGAKTFTFSTPGTYTVRVVALVNGGGAACTDTSKVAITILASPVANFSLNPTIACNTATNVQFTDFSTGAAAWNWTFANGNTSTQQVPPPQDYTLTGLFSPSLVVTGTTGCSNTQTQSIIIRPNPVPAFSQFTTCVGGTTTFTNNSTITGTNAITNYTWDFGDTSPVVTGTSPVVHTYTAPNTYTVKLTATTAFCSALIELPIVINVKPTASFVISPTIGCTALTAGFTNNSINATHYTWNFGTNPPSSSNATNTSFTYSNFTQSVQNYTVELIASTGAGCSSSVTGVLSVNPKPVPNYTLNSITGCSPFSTTFSNTSVGNNINAWIFGDGGSAISVNASHVFTNTTLFTQTVSTKLVVTNSLGCKDSVSKVITIYPEALPNFSMIPPSGCSPLVVNFPSIPGVSTYSWNHGDGSPTFTTVSSHSYTYTNTGLTDLTLTVTLNALTTNGCAGTDVKTVGVFANPKADFVFSPTAACTPMLVNFTNTSTGNASNTWYISNGQVQAVVNAVTGFTNQTGGNEQTQTAKLVVTSTKNCKDSITKNIVVYQQPKAIFSADTPACSPKSITFGNGSLAGNSYKWYFGDGSTSTQSVGTHAYINSTQLPVTYTVKLVTTSVHNCSDSVGAAVAIHPKPTFFITSSPDSGCSPLRVVFQKINGVKTYQWKYDNIAFGNTGDIHSNFENKTTNAKVINIQLVATDAFNCVDTAHKVLKVFPLPTAKYSANPLSVYIPNQATQFTNLSTSAATYTWSFGDGKNSKEFSPSHTYAAAGEFSTSLIVTSNRGCRDTFSLPEKVIALDETAVAMPNAFTPNPAGSKGGFYDPDDKSNDIFHPNIKGADKYSFSIYSRWGELLFETKDPDEGWDGYYKGKLCTQDVYIWKVTAVFIDGKVYNKTGDLLLLR